MTLPLEGVKVLEYAEQGFVPSAVAALADWGADVVKIERPGTGDQLRAVMRQGLVTPADGTDYLFESFNRNKRGVSIDIESPAGREVFDRLVGWADVYITNHLPRVRRKLRTEPADLHAINPGLVYAKGHGQGQTGPDAEEGGYDSVSFWSRGGVGHMLTPDGAETFTMQRPAQGDVTSGMFLAGSICAGLVHRLRTGTGVVVDLAMLNAAIWTLQPDMAFTSITGTEARMAANGAVIGSNPLVGAHRSADGKWFNMTMLDPDRYWEPLTGALGLDHLRERYPTGADACTERDTVFAAIADRIASLPAAEVRERLRANSCIFAMLADPPEVLADSAVTANGYLPSHPTHPSLRLAAAPAQFDDEQITIRRPAPSRGEHNDEVLAELGYDETQRDQLRAAGVLDDGD